ncbi:hypothetical protein NQ117_06010 [Paenibacillus sp. SC116]|uniref:hypothetical protein n=1 Tax=Paenibacillus sp. SC116 TaxID=2968986 RepID=UPI00215ABBE2|nr:hypothetical protein [Paenibacillus sp. SC116]MCR8843230.1 hypothetical protein [Paenibacillus sp. SC116]
MSNIQSSTIQLHYVEWDSVLLQEKGLVSNWKVTRDYMFVCKLTDAVVIRNRLWEHVSHETNLLQQAAIYVIPFVGINMNDYRAGIQAVIFDGQCKVAEQFNVEWHLWQDQRFHLLSSYQPEGALDAASLLLDHYAFVDQREVEMLLTVLDTDRNTLLLFAKPA